MVVVGHFFGGMIRLYQRFLSPYKGFCCAYRYHTGRYSCSEYGYRLVKRKGVIVFLHGLRRQFQRCRSAHASIVQGRYFTWSKRVYYVPYSVSERRSDTQYMSSRSYPQVASRRARCGQSRAKCGQFCGAKVRACYHYLISSRKKSTSNHSSRCDDVCDVCEVCDFGLNVSSVCDGLPCDCSF